MPVPGGREAFGSMTSGACSAGRSEQDRAWGARSDRKAGSGLEGLVYHTEDVAFSLTDGFEQGSDMI